MAVPRLELDRPFTYLLPEDAEPAGVGSLVSVPFHGRTVKAWVLGPAADVPPGRLLAVRKVRSPVRFFDGRMLALLRWVGERYIAPLSVVIERSHPPRVASVEGGSVRRPLPNPGPAAEHLGPRQWPTLDRYGGPGILAAGSSTWLRPLPDEEAAVCVEAVGATVAGGKQALVLVPEADPMPHTARAVLDAFGERAVGFLAGDARDRYRTWLSVLAGGFDVVVGTRPAVFSPLAEPGLIWISREVHPGHREDRSPYYHVREVAAARAGIEGAACILSSLSPSVESAAACAAGALRVARAPRALERAAAPLVESAPPEAEDRSVRLGRLLKTARGAALIVSRRGYGIARVCRSCGEPASCGACGGPIVAEAGRAHCGVCGAEGVCANCGGRTFGLERGGTERIAEWASRISPLPVAVETRGGGARRPDPGTVLVATAAAVKDVGPVRLELVAILDPDRALSRPGIHAGEQALATWMEAGAWAGSRSGGGRVLVQTRRPGNTAVQALVRWEPLPFLLAEAGRRREAGFPPGHGIFRVSGRGGLDEALRAAGAETVLATAGGDGTVCLVAVPPERLHAFRGEVLLLAAEGEVARVEAEPQV